MQRLSSNRLWHAEDKITIFLYSYRVTSHVPLSSFTFERGNCCLKNIRDRSSVIGGWCVHIFVWMRWKNGTATERGRQNVSQLLLDDTVLRPVSHPHNTWPVHCFRWNNIAYIINNRVISEEYLSTSIISSKYNI